MTDLRALVPGLCVQQADYANPEHARALVSLLDAYARDPAGGGRPLSDWARQRLIPELAARPHAYSVLAFVDASEARQAVGFVNAFVGYSTFAGAALVNVHDVGVLPEWRGRGVASALLREVERLAVQRGAVKLTLEVLSGNATAGRLYRGLGFAPYELDPSMGSALLMQKWLSGSDAGQGA